jgi:ApaG protein
MADGKYDITIAARTAFLPEQSDANADRYVFAYTITITNTGTVPAQLVSRHWIITDANNGVQEVRGAGVVGEQPLLRPGQSFEYTSGTPLPTPSGIMTGSYEMEGSNGEKFSVAIPAFSLDSPHQQIRMN